MAVLFGLGAIVYAVNLGRIATDFWFIVILALVFLYLRQVVVSQGRVKGRRAAVRARAETTQTVQGAPASTPVASGGALLPQNDLLAAPVQTEAPTVQVGRSL